jgi:signal transduction histidine kinase
MQEGSTDSRTAPRVPTVLIVDDNAQNRALARMTLEDEGYGVLLAENGPTALELFVRHAPDCVLLDVRMPGMDGPAVCERLRAMPEGTEVPVVFLTAARDVATFDRALRSGATDFLTKPVQPAELVLRVRQALEVRRLGGELRAQYDLLRQQRDELFRIQLQKEDLASFVVHDLKNPVNAIDLQAQLILRDRQLSPRSRDAASRVRDDVRDLLRLIHNLLDVTRGEQGQLVPTRSRVDLRTLIAGVFDARRAQADDRGVTLASRVEAPELDADPELLRRVVENLMENAIRHAPSGSTVRVETAPRADATEVIVADEGPGIPAELRTTVFERYTQLGRAEDVRARGGRGLGLTFCKLAVEAHGGTICAEDGSPGAVFRVCLPAGATRGAA